MYRAGLGICASVPRDEKERCLHNAGLTQRVLLSLLPRHRFCSRHRLGRVRHDPRLALVAAPPTRSTLGQTPREIQIRIGH